MIKKLLSLIAIVLLGYNVYGQTIVSTDPENKKVILEEFTGIYCVFCPDGHAIAQAIQNSNPGQVFLINIHEGSFAAPSGSDPDFRTPWGTAIAGQTGLIGYPAGTVNRHNFPGFEQGASGTTAMSRNVWANAANQILSAGSYVNVGVEAEIDVQNSEITVHVEGYYTGNSPEATNLLNVALLQNNTLGPQTGGNAGNNYVHMHRLVDMITGQWGMSIPTTTSSTFVDETFTYTIPADYNGVPVVLEDMEVVAFITETQQEIASGSGCYPSFTNLPLANDTNVEYIEDINDQCGIDFGPRVRIQNTGNNLLTSVDFEYSVNSGTAANYTWTGSLNSYESTTVQLPGIPYTMQGTNTVDVSVANDDDNTNNDASGSFGETTLISSQYLNLILNTDSFGNETTWTMTDPTGTVIASGGPYGNNITVTESIDLAVAGCHEFRVVDEGGNGSGSIVLYDSNNDIQFQSAGNYGGGQGASFVSDGILGINSDQLNKVIVYPNPATTVLNINNAENAMVEIYNVLGQVLYTKNNISIQQEIEVSSLNSGTYFVKITNGNAVKTSKFVKQ